MITLPIYWTEKFKRKVDKVWLVGMNAYRNWHYHTSNTFKQEFAELVHNQSLSIKPIKSTFTLNIAIYYKNPSCDGSNIAALIEKVVLDQLQKDGIIKQDNVKWHLGSTWRIIEQDKENPRVEITIKELNEQK